MKLTHSLQGGLASQAAAGELGSFAAAPEARTPKELEGLGEGSRG